MIDTQRGFLFAVLSVLCGLGLAAQTNAADAVVGTGSPTSCNEAALNTAVGSVKAGGGTITFNCGGPATINITSEKRFDTAGVAYAIDGGGLITISGQNVTRIIFHLRGTLSIRNITLQNGRASGAQDDASGGAIRSDNGGVVLNLTGVVFRSNATKLTAVPPAPFSTFDYGGGAVYSRLGTLRVTNCTFANNTANNSSGGAIHARSSTIDISGSTFTANASNDGGFAGAIFTDGLSPGGSNGTLRITTSTFTDNTAWNIGGAFYFFMHANKNESVTLDRVTFLNNRVDNNSGTIPWLGTSVYGGAGVAEWGSVTILNSTIAGNIAFSPVGRGAGGGTSLTNDPLVNPAAVFNITNSTFSGNRADGVVEDNSSGGGLVIGGSAQPFQIRNSTIASNYARWTGGGIQSGDTNGVLTNTIVANNTADNPFNIQDQCSFQLTNGGGVLHYPNIVGAPSSQNPYCASGAIVADPVLSPLASNGGPTQTRALGAGSAAIDAGTNAGCPTTDQRGWPRPVDGDGNGSVVCDIGAYERLTTVFADVPGSYWARPWIEAVYRAGITGGCSADPLLFCPESSVTRGQMAVFLLRSKEGGAYQPPPCTVPTFGDVPCSNTFAAWIEDLFDRGITSGCSVNPPLYCPGNAVTRGQMAVFLLRTLNGSNYTPGACQNVFADLPCSNAFAAWAEDLYDLGVTSGCNTNPLRYCPDNPVTRAQMAVFLVRTFSIPL